MKTYYESMNCIYSIKAENKMIECSCLDTVSCLKSFGSTISKDAFLKLYSLMKENKCLEIHAITGPDMKEYDIHLVYRLDKLTGRKSSYIYAIGENAKSKAAKNSSITFIEKDIYKSVFNDH